AAYQVAGRGKHQDIRVARQRTHSWIVTLPRTRRQTLDRASRREYVPGGKKTADADFVDAGAHHWRETPSVFVAQIRCVRDVTAPVQRIREQRLRPRAHRLVDTRRLEHGTTDGFGF